MRGLRSFLVLLVVAIGLGAYIYFVERKRPSAEDAATKREKVFTVESSAIEELEIQSEKGERTKLTKTGGAWRIVAPEATAADESEVSSIASSLATLEIQRVVEEKPSDLAEYGLKAPRVEVRFRATGGTEARLLIGRKTPTGGDMYAKLAGADRVFLIPAYLDSTFNRGTFDLRDKAVLKFARDKVDGLEIAAGSGTIAFSKSGAEWRLTAPVAARAEYSAVEGVIGRLESARMSAIVASGETTDLKPYGLDKPTAVVHVATGSARATIAFGKTTDDNKVYARDLSRPLVFTVDKYVLDDINKPAAEFRRKDLFEFRPFTATRVEIERDGRRYVFEKTKGKDGAETWKQTAPAARDVDQSKMESALSAFANLRAQAFVDSTRGTGLDHPVVTVTVNFGDGEQKKRERVRFGRAGQDAYGLPEGEPGAAKLTASDLDNALKALDELVK
jgi:hypothetical protein